MPAYFDEPRRKATADAGEMAGLRVLDIVNEPTAAALAFGEALGYLSPDGLPSEQMTVMVYDLGGGTFDVTLLQLAAGNVQTLATDGDVQLGGHDWDQRLVDYAAEAFRKQHRLDPREDPAALNRLFQAVMEAKHTLSARSRASIRVEYAGRSVEVPIVREQFEEMTGRPAGADGLHLAATAGGRRPAVEGRQPRPPGGRFHPHAHGPAHVAEAHRASSPTARSIPTRPWPAAPPCMPATCWPSGHGGRGGRPASASR